LRRALGTPSLPGEQQPTLQRITQHSCQLHFWAGSRFVEHAMTVYAHRWEHTNVHMIKLEVRGK